MSNARGFLLWIRLAIACTAIGLFALYRTDFGIDDAWITYRYAENLADGFGFVYNPGERVLGTSTPLYALLLALIRWVHLPVHLTSQFIGLCAMLATLHGVFLLTSRLHSAQAGLLAAALLASMQVFHRVVTYGMETSLYVCLIVYAFYSFVTERFVLAAVLAALCLLLRLDGLAVGAALALSYVLTRRRMPWRAIAAYVVVALPWFIFSYAYFGSLVPNSMLAKRAHTHYQLMMWMPEWLLTQSYTIIGLIGAAIAVSVQGTRMAALPIVIWSAGYVAAYVSSSLQGYEWYRTPLTVSLAIFSGVAITEIGERLFADRRVRVLMVSLFVAWLVAPDVYRLGRRLGNDWDLLEVEAVRFQAAHWLADNVPGDAVIAVGGIGHVGYFTHNYILDAMGLVSPQVITTEGALPSAEDVPIPRFLETSVERYQPEYVFDGFWLPRGEEVPAFMLSDYAVVRKWPVGGADEPTFILYRRKSIETASRHR